MNKRLKWLDIAKGIGIILLLVGHRTNGQVNNYIYLFHMPLFFILSGYVVKDNIVAERKDESKIISSYFAYSIIYLAFSYYMNRNGNINDFYDSFINTITLRGEHTLWFLTTLWFTKIVVTRLFCKKKKSVIIIVIIYILSFILSSLYQKNQLKIDVLRVN